MSGNAYADHKNNWAKGNRDFNNRDSDPKVGSYRVAAVVYENFKKYGHDADQTVIVSYISKKDAMEKALNQCGSRCIILDVWYWSKNLAINLYYENTFYEQEKKYLAKHKQITSGEITFTINDKKEQCEAIGFTPQTDKFADCVLRLVELDVKSQQQKQIELALSQGNQQIADELRKQRNQQGGQYLMDLGQKLLTPTAPASLPTTRNCTVRGTGVYKTVTCW